MEQEDPGLRLRHVRQSRPITDSRTTSLLIYLNSSLYLAQFVESLFSAVQSNLNPYITSSFGEHGLTAVVSIVASITGGVCNLFIAKVLDIWGRVEGFFCMLLLIVVGSIMKAACHNIETYAAANTIYWVSRPHFASAFVRPNQRRSVTSVSYTSSPSF
jgi:MFS family permease